jgi:hypothetical protein
MIKIAALICMLDVPPDKCDRNTAIDSFVVGEQTICMLNTAQMTLGRSPLVTGTGGGTYVKMECER